MTLRWARITPKKIHLHDNRIYEDSKTEVWVSGLLKKQLKELNVTILKTHNFDGDWGFLMSVADGELVQKKYPKPIYKDGRIDWNATEKARKEASA